MNIKYFDAHGADTTLNEFAGQKIQIIRPLTKDEADLEDVGMMYKCMLPDGREIDAFEDEIKDAQYGLIGPYNDGSNAVKFARVFFGENGTDTMNVDIYDVSTLLGALQLYDVARYDMEIACDAIDDAFFIEDSDPRYSSFIKSDYAVLTDDYNTFNRATCEKLEQILDAQALKINNAMCDYIARGYGSEIQDPSYDIPRLACTIAEELSANTYTEVPGKDGAK